MQICFSTATSVTLLLGFYSEFLFFNIQGDEAQGKDGLLILKSVKRSDAAQYKCTALDFEIDFTLEKTIALTVDCE